MRYLRMVSPRTVVLVGVLFCFGYGSVPGTAQAMLRRNAHAKALTFQVYQCNHHTERCFDSTYVLPHCEGPFKDRFRPAGDVQWVCKGGIQVELDDSIQVCLVYTEWSKWGFLVDGSRTCVPVPISQDGAMS